jgi:putative peptidoglycan lipid II flippase
VLQLAFQLPFLKRIGMLPRPRWPLKHSGVWRVVRQMGPAIFGVSIGQISLLINTIFASYLATGSVSWLYYADRLMEFPTGVLGVALGTILLPSLAKSYAEQSSAEYSRLLDWGLRLTLLLALPSALALAILAVPLIATLFHYGAFDPHDVVMTSQALIAYSVGLVGLIVVKVLAPGFYARQDIRTPVRIGIMTLAATQVMNAMFYRPLAHTGLALAIGLGACINAALLYYNLRRGALFEPQPGWRKFFLQLGGALLAMGLTLWISSGSAAGWLEGSVWMRITRLAWVVAAGAGVYFAVLWILGIRPAQFAKKAR